jgi:predicted small secreted protein
MIYFLKIYFFYQAEITDSDVNANDFEEIIDSETGKKVLRMKKEVAERKGFVDMDDVDFEYVIDNKTGQRVIQIKNSTGKLTKENVTFEMIIDPKTGQQTLRMKQDVEIKRTKIYFLFLIGIFFCLVETIENDLANEDFEEVIDEVTGERILKLTVEAAARKGLSDLRDVAFEVYVDPTTGKEQIRMKGGNQTGKLDGDQKFEIYIDEKTGQQKIILKRPKGRTRKIFYLRFVFVQMFLFV